MPRVIKRPYVLFLILITQQCIRQSPKAAMSGFFARVQLLVDQGMDRNDAILTVLPHLFKEQRKAVVKPC
jgi:hypothetical protein